MFSLVEPSRSRAVSRLALAAALSAGIAGCSSDFSRMTENPWGSKPQASHQGSAGSNEVTGSVRQQSAPTGQVESQPLAAPTYGGGSGMGSYNPPQAASAPPPARPQQSPRPEYTGSISAPAPRQPAQKLELGRRHRHHRRAGRNHRDHRAPPSRAGARDPAGEQHAPRLAAAAGPAPGHSARRRRTERRRAADARGRSEPCARAVRQRACRRAGRDDLLARAPLSHHADGDRESEQRRARASASCRRARGHSGQRTAPRASGPAEGRSRRCRRSLSPLRSRRNWPPRVPKPPRA